MINNLYKNQLAKYFQLLDNQNMAAPITHIALTEKIFDSLIK